MKIYAAIFCHNDELSSSLNCLEICLQLSFLKSATRYMKVNGMRIQEILRRIWLLSANKIKPSESMETEERGMCDPETVCFQAYHVIC